MIGLLRRRPTFRQLFLAHAISRAGDAFNTVALVVLVFRLTGSGRGVAITVVFEIVPVLAFAPLAGLAADRLPRRRVMIGADVLRAVAACVLALITGSVLVAYFVAFALATGSVFFNPAASSLVPDTVEEHELVDANAALWTVAVVAQVVLAPLAGLIIGALGIGVAFAINAASFVVSALVLAGLPAGRSPLAAGDRRGWGAITAGVSAVRASSLLSRLAVVQVLAALSAGATSGLLVVLAADWLGVGAGGFGVLLAAIGIGAAVGPQLARRWAAPGHKVWLFGPYAVRGGVDLTLAAIGNPVAAGVGLFFYGASTSAGTVAYNATMQRMVATETRGRAFAFFDLLWNASRLISLAAGGFLADALGIRSVYVLGAMLLLLAAAYGLTTPIPVARESSPQPS